MTSRVFNTGRLCISIQYFRHMGVVEDKYPVFYILADYKEELSDNTCAFWYRCIVAEEPRPFSRHEESHKFIYDF